MSQLLEESSATSTRLGTRLPRPGLFIGRRPPAYRSSIVIGGPLEAETTNETPFFSWTEARTLGIQQTVSPTLAATNLRVDHFVVQVNTSFPLTPPSLASEALRSGSFVRGVPLRAIRETDVAFLVVTPRPGATESAWQHFRVALAPLRAAPTAVLEMIGEQLREREHRSDPVQHIGLDAVSWLERILHVARPAILKMGAVSESTFYAWQKSPSSSVRTPTVVRLLRLQAQIGLLMDAIGPEGLRQWLMTGNRFDRLQADDESFNSVWAEADRDFDSRSRITGRRRMHVEDYTGGPEPPEAGPDVDLPPTLSARRFVDKAPD